MSGAVALLPDMAHNIRSKTHNPCLHCEISKFNSKLDMQGCAPHRNVLDLTNALRQLKFSAAGPCCTPAPCNPCSSQRPQPGAQCGKAMPLHGAPSCRRQQRTRGKKIVLERVGPAFGSFLNFFQIVLEATGGAVSGLGDTVHAVRAQTSYARTQNACSG